MTTILSFDDVFKRSKLSNICKICRTTKSIDLSRVGGGSREAWRKHCVNNHGEEDWTWTAPKHPTKIFEYTKREIHCKLCNRKAGWTCGGLLDHMRIWHGDIKVAQFEFAKFSKDAIAQRKKMKNTKKKLSPASDLVIAEISKRTDTSHQEEEEADICGATSVQQFDQPSPVPFCQLCISEDETNDSDPKDGILLATGQEVEVATVLVQLAGCGAGHATGKPSQLNSNVETPRCKQSKEAIEGIHGSCKLWSFS